MAETTLDKLFRTLTEDNSDAALAEEVRKISAKSDNVQLPAELLQDGKEDSEGNLAALIKGMSIPQKVKLALFGNQIARNILIRDTNRQIPMFVLQNARLTDSEIYEYAKNTNLDENVLREISNNSQWMKSYPVKVALCSNPKAPIDVSLKWIRYLQIQDVRKLARSKNVPQIIASQCRKILDQEAKKNKPRE